VYDPPLATLAVCDHSRPALVYRTAHATAPLTYQAILDSPRSCLLDIGTRASGCARSDLVVPAAPSRDVHACVIVLMSERFAFTRLRANSKSVHTVAYAPDRPGLLWAPRLSWNQLRQWLRWLEALQHLCELSADRAVELCFARAPRSSRTGSLNYRTGSVGDVCERSDGTNLS
jgi:hypothetical protein